MRNKSKDKKRDNKEEDKGKPSKEISGNRKSEKKHETGKEKDISESIINKIKKIKDVPGIIKNRIIIITKKNEKFKTLLTLSFITCMCEMGIIWCK